MRRLVEFLEEHPDVGLAAGTISYRGASASQREQTYFAYESRVRSLESRHQSCVCVAGQLEMHRVELWRPLPNGVATDMGTALMVLAQGSGCVQVPAAQVWTPAGARVSTELRRKRRTIRRGLRTISWKWGELGARQRLFLLNHKLLRYALPIAEATGFAGLVLVACTSGLASLTAQLTIGLAACALAAGALLAWRDYTGPAWARLLVAGWYFHAVHVIALGELAAGWPAMFPRRVGARPATRAAWRRH